MSTFLNFMTMIIDFMKIPINLYGFETSFWGIFLFVAVGTMIFRFIGGVLDHE